jgi:hypothetical protein
MILERQQAHSGNGLILIAIILILIILVPIVATLPQVQIPTILDHAEERHAAEMSPLISCFSGNGTINPRAMFNPVTKRTAWMCQMDGDMFIWIIDEAENTVTQFKNKAKSFEDAVKYLIRRGYY